MMSNLDALPAYRRPMTDVLARRLDEPRRFIRVVAGPRQVGKTTLIRQILASSDMPHRYGSADEPTLRGRLWIEEQWDEDTAEGRGLKLVLLESASLLIQQGLMESLAGRFEIGHLSHCSYAEMRDAFGWSLDSYVFYGGYPEAAPLIEEPERWSRYILDALIETTISRDVLLLTRVDKPALFRRLFDLACGYRGVGLPRVLGADLDS